MTEEWCDVASSEDLDSEGKPNPDTLRQRLELYNANRPKQCSFLIYFLYRHEKILLQKPLILKKHPRDRNPEPDQEFLTGTYISGYGPGGTSDRLDIELDEQEITTDPNPCAIMI